MAARAGTSALTLLSVPLHAFLLQALAQGSMALIDLRRQVGSPAQTTMRAHLRALTEIGVVKKSQQDLFPGALHYELDAPGHDLLGVAEVLGAWLRVAPGAALSLGSVAAKNAVKALVDGWTTSMLRALAARPLSLTELDDLISGLSYPSLERRLGAMRFAGQVEPLPSNGRGTPHSVTRWMRQAVAPLAASARWERRYMPDHTARLTNRDAEAALLLAVPLLRLPISVSGSCRLAVEIGVGERQRLAGVMVGVERGGIASCTSRLDSNPDAWAVGSPFAWLDAILDQDIARLEIGGDGRLAGALVDGLHGTLFDVRQHA